MIVKIKYDLVLMKLMALFEQKTRTRPKDAFEDGNGLLYFVVDKGLISKAVGKQGANAKRLTGLLNRKIKIVEFDADRETFIKRLVFPLKIVETSSEGDIVTVKGEDVETNSRIIGRNASNLRNYEKIVKRYFTLDEIKVI